MAKMFYTLEETKAALGKSEDEIKQLSREGQLREFRDGPRLMFKADQVEALKGQGGSGDQVDLGGAPSGDTGSPIGLMDSKTGSGTGVAMPPGGAQKEDTAAGLDVGLSGSLGGSLGGASLAGSIGGSIGGSMGGSRGPVKQGVNVFDESNEAVDPMAQTHITPPKDQISLEGVGSGSGLLDLTRETDDTSLGAALLDEISPGGTKKSGSPLGAPSSGSTAGMSAVGMEIEPMSQGRPIMVQQVAYVTAFDPVAPAFVGAGVAAAVAILFAAMVLINAIVDRNPLVDARYEFLRSMPPGTKGFLYVFIAGVIVAIIAAIVGYFAGRMGGGVKQSAA